MIGKFQRFPKHKFIKNLNRTFSKQILQLKLKKEIFSLQNLLRLSNSYPKIPTKTLSQKL